MGSKYEYLNTKIHIDKKGKGGGVLTFSCIVAIGITFSSGYFFFRVLFVGYFEYFQDFIKFLYGTVLSIIRCHTMDFDQVLGGGARLIVEEENQVWCWRRTTPPKKYQIVAPYNQTKHLYTFQMHLDLIPKNFMELTRKNHNL